jgi:hypothetical protein
MLDKVEHRRLRPVDVLDDDDERPRGRHCLEQLAHAPEGLLDGKLLRGKSDGRGHASSHSVVLRESGNLRPRHLRRILFEDSGCFPDDFDDRPERDAAPV